MRRILLCVALAVLLLALVSGAIPLAPGQALRALFAGPDDSLPGVLVWQHRLPRFGLGALAGAALAASGVLLQGALRNDLADPGLLGVSSGASLVVAVVVIGDFAIAPALLPLCAMAGGVTAGLVILLATRMTRDPVQMIMFGAALAALFSACIVFVVVLGNEFQIRTVYLYLAGSLAGRDGTDLRRLASWLLVALPLCFLLRRPLNLLRLGEDMADGLGLNAARMRLLILLLAIGLVAPVVAVCGPIGFIALVAPHIARAWLGASDAGRVLPLSMLLGAVLLPTADLAAREVMRPAELPVGLLVTAFGAPVALWLLRRRVPA